MNYVKVIKNVAQNNEYLYIHMYTRLSLELAQ